MRRTACLAIALMSAAPVVGQSPGEPPDAAPKPPAKWVEPLNFAEQILARKIDDQMLFHRLEDLAVVDRVRYTGPPPRVVKNPTAPGAKNPVVITAYTFLPRKHLPNQKLPLVVFAHGGVHGNVGVNYVAEFRELLQQGYA